MIPKLSVKVSLKYQRFTPSIAKIQGCEDMSLWQRLNFFIFILGWNTEKTSMGIFVQNIIFIKSTVSINQVNLHANMAMPNSQRYP